MNKAGRVIGLAGPEGADRVADWLESGWVAMPARDWMSVAHSGNPLTCLVGEDGRLVYISRAAERWKLVDADVAQARGRSLHDILHPGCDDAGCVFAGLDGEIAAARGAAKPVMRELEDARLGRHLKLVIMPVVVMPLQCGVGTAPNAAIVTLHDLTPQKRTETWLRESVEELGQELKRRTAALEEATEAQQKAETGLRRSESEFRLVSTALMTMQEIERKRIATELHDSVGQSLSALGFGVGVALDAARSGDARMACEMLEKLSPQVKETVAEVRRIAMDLRPATLDDLGIVGTLSWFFREFRAIHPGLELQTDVALYEEDVPPALRTTIFRVVQEALNNVVKHARARVVRVRLWRADREVHLEVADDGRGFATAGNALGAVAGSGMGLKGMRDRAEFSGGTFRLESEPGKGTTIAAGWPIRAD